MLYRLLKIPAKLAFWIYCRHISINNRSILDTNGPLLIASNHPNSFLDAVMLATLFRKPVYSLVRGDVYKNKFYASVLTSLKMLPVFRISEGVENLEQNYETFEKCKEIFKKNGIVLIFSEGRCINEWKLRSLKKGTARLAISSWEDGIGLTILPTGINYQSFKSFGKNVTLNFGKMIRKTDIHNTNGYGNTINEFNEKLKEELKTLVAEIDPNDKVTIFTKFNIKQPLLKRIALFLPAVTGFLLHCPLYIPVQKFTWRRASQNDHYDSIMVGLLFILYPLYLMLFVLLVYWLAGYYWWILPFIVLPFCAWSYVQIKRQF